MVTAASSELYDEGLGFEDSRRPVLTSFSDPVILGTSVTGSGSQFHEVSEASGGAANNSATNYPLVQLHRLDNDQTLFLPLESPSVSRYIHVLASPAIPVVAGSPAIVGGRVGH